MKPFRATYTPSNYVDKKASEAHARIVLVIAVGVDEVGAYAIFIDADNRLDAAPLDHFTDCQSSEWRE